MNPIRKLPDPTGEIKKQAALQSAFLDIKGLVKATLNEDTPISETARSALSSMYQAIYGVDIAPHQKQLILRSLVAKRMTSWIDLGELSEAEEDQLVQKNLWILEVPVF